MADKPKNIEAIYNAALKKSSGAQRSSYLDAACGDDNVLRGRVEALLKAHEQAGSFLEIPAIDSNVTIDGPAQIEGPGTKIGRYELLSLIGEGGMGLVYLAEQKEPVKRRVALKIIKPGMDSAQVIARFEAERQALALLDHPNIAHVFDAHPNIAHVFDAGTTEASRPYFVMEYVKGMSITAYCDEYKLNIEQRLNLFEHVCEGIHHAHQKGIRQGGTEDYRLRNCQGYCQLTDGQDPIYQPGPVVRHAGVYESRAGGLGDSRYRHALGYLLSWRAPL